MMATTWGEIIKTLYTRYRNLVLYGIIGAGSVTIDFAIFWLLTYFFPEYYILANVISVNCGIINSFLLNRHFNFKVKNKSVFRFVVFYIVGILGLLISSGLLYFMVDLRGMPVLWAKVLTLFVVTIFQFTLNKNITFRQNG